MALRGFWIYEQELGQRHGCSEPGSIPVESLIVSRSRCLRPISAWSSERCSARARTVFGSSSPPASWHDSAQVRRGHAESTPARSHAEQTCFTRPQIPLRLKKVRLSWSLPWFRIGTDTSACGRGFLTTVARPYGTRPRDVVAGVGGRCSSIALPDSQTPGRAEFDDIVDDVFHGHPPGISQVGPDGNRNNRCTARKPRPWSGRAGTAAGCCHHRLAGWY
jgi:hypothetical protein